MTASRDPDRLIRAFLGEGRTELPDASFDAVRAGIDRTRQRVVIGPWREPSMSTMFRLAGAAAVVAVVLAGAAIVTRPTVGPLASPQPSPSAAGEPSAGPTRLTYTWPGPLVAGDYSTSFSFDLDFEIAFTVPAGWESRDIEVVKGAAFVSFQLVANTFTDPCSNKETTPAVGPTVDDLATALVADPALRVTAPKAVQLAGYPGVSLTYDPAEGVSCVGEDSRTWALPADRILPVGPLGPPTWPLRAGTHRVWILDINGTRLVIDASAGPTPAAPLSAEVQAVVDSVQFGPLTHPITIGACTLNIDHQSSPPGQPLEVTLGPTLPGGLNGPAPNPFPSLGPVAWLNFRGEGWQEGRGSPGGPRMIPPPGATTTGFQTTTTVNGYAGSWVFDAPGTWWVKFTGDLSGCVRQFPVIVHPAP